MRRLLAAIACALALASCYVLAPTASAYSSTGTPEQIAWVRRAAGNFLAAELARNGASACGILAAPLRATSHGVSCQARWDARIRRLLREPGARAQLRADRHAAPSAVVSVHGGQATIELPTPLLDGHSRFVWSEMCWMLER
jgi:hypothetical protein